MTIAYARVKVTDVAAKGQPPRHWLTDDITKNGGLDTHAIMAYNAAGDDAVGVIIKKFDLEIIMDPYVSDQHESEKQPSYCLRHITPQNTPELGVWTAPCRLVGHA
ncbi:hypothetical protein AVEN_145588-1 [Araneus ventricosus]|uniref:Uncharacterized protein n=1 Tax=Araneus ventricosus TaxID=182803 RepID=A0A4Y2SCH6_ARAVE|nr:hypothetical protein AVEN_145588-1 [Araneus ventricosus]